MQTQNHSQAQPTDRPHDYNALTPDVVLQAIEQLGLEPGGRMLALNSYENRVYRIELENGAPVVVKFYRPHRWPDAAIREEHDFSQELAASDIPVVPPTAFNGDTLHCINTGGSDFRYAVFALHGGRWPDLEQRDDLIWMGRFIGRIHSVGARQTFAHRHSIDIARMGAASSDYLLAKHFIPDHLIDAYQSLSADLLDQIAACFERAGDFTPIRLHGDCHRGNVLWTEGGPHFVDFDDCCNGPAIQDLWMLLSGEREEMTAQLCDLLEGYSDFAEPELSQLHLIEALRSLRMMHYAAWLARRWTDPAFPQAFPWFNTVNYWEQHILELREQLARMQEPVLVV